MALFDQYPHDFPYSGFSSDWDLIFKHQDLKVKPEETLSPIDLEPFSSPFEDSSSSSDEGSSTPYDYGFNYSSPSQLSSTPLLTLSPLQRKSWRDFKEDLGTKGIKVDPTLTVTPSDLTRSESPTFSESDATPPPTMHLLVRAARSYSASSLFSIDPDAQSNWDDSDKDEDYKPESDSDEPVFISSGKRKRSSSVDSYTPEIIEKKPRISGPVKPPTAKRAIKLPSAKLARVRPSVNRTRVAPPSRNIQVDSMMAAHIREKLACTKTTNNDWVCPACSWAQHNHRMPDYKRHLKTHLPEVVHWCCGVPLSEAEKYHISPDAETFMHGGELRTGGCMRSFSRADALTRHIGNPNMPCVAEHKDDRAY